MTYVLVWTGENDTKTLVWMKIFCFVFAAMKADTFENALLWMGPWLVSMLVSIEYRSQSKFALYLKKADLASRNIVHL